MTPRMAVVLTTALLLGGCSSPRWAWYKEGGTEEQRTRDERECWDLAVRTAEPAYDLEHPGMRMEFYGRERDRIFEECMQARGYRRIPGVPGVCR